MTDMREDVPVQSALLIDATGIVGRRLLLEALKTKNFNRVGEYGRQVTPASEIPSEFAPKLQQKVVDPAELNEAGLNEGHWDVVFITLGGSEEYQESDNEFVINAARAARTDRPNQKQRLVYLSSSGANPTSSKEELKDKGVTEQALAQLGYNEFIVFRPIFVTGARFRLQNIFLRPMLEAVALVTPSLSVPLSELARSLCLAGELGKKGIRDDDQTEGSWDGPTFTVVPTAGAVRISHRVYM